MESHPPSEPGSPGPPAEPPAFPPEPPATPPSDPDRHPIRVVVTDDLERSRVTVFFRWLLAIPLLIWLVIWSIGAFFVAIANWFVTLVKGRTPISLHDFFASYVRFTTHVHAYLFLAADPYPSFSGKPGYPIDVEIDPPEPQSRWKTAFRFFLALKCLCVPWQRSTKLVFTDPDRPDSSRVRSNRSKLPSTSRSLTATTRPPSFSLWTVA